MLATVSDALPESTAALVVFACISGSGGDVAVGCLVWMVLGICFRCDLVVLHFFSYDFWVRDLIRNSVCDPNILAIRQQTGKGSEMVSDIFETLIFTVWTKCCGHFMFFIGKLFKHLVVTISSAVKKAGVLNLQICCLTK